MATRRLPLHIGDRIILLGAGLRDDLIGVTGTVVGFYNKHLPAVALARIAPDDRPEHIVSLPVEFVMHNPADWALRQLLRVAPPPKLHADWSKTVSWESVGWQPTLEKYANAILMIQQDMRARIRRVGGPK